MIYRIRIRYLLGDEARVQPIFASKLEHAQAAAAVFLNEMISQHGEAFRLRCIEGHREAA